jgi:ubiquinone/menaquinone biosynthesis C-methylase UbiE
LSGGSRFDRTAGEYAAHAANRDWAGFVAWCECRPTDRVLDVAGGPGTLAGAVRDAVASVVVVDVAPALLAYVPEGIERVEARAEQLPFAAGTFDLVTCVNSLHHIARPARALDEMARVLAPGGRIVLEDFAPDPDARRARRWEEIERLRDPEHGRLIAPAEMRAPLQAAGLHLDAEEAWLRTSAVEPWLAVAGVTGAAAARIRQMIAAPEFEVRVWRARYRRREP